MRISAIDKRNIIYVSANSELHAQEVMFCTGWIIDLVLYYAGLMEKDMDHSALEQLLTTSVLL